MQPCPPPFAHGPIPFPVVMGTGSRVTGRGHKQSQSRFWFGMEEATELVVGRHLQSLGSVSVAGGKEVNP